MASNRSQQELFNKIKEQGIQPKPKWIFRTRTCLLWGLAGVFILLEGVAVSVVIYVFRHSDWSVYKQLAAGWWEFLLLFLPVFWLLLVAVTVFLVFYNFRHIPRGYRYPAYMLVAAIILAGVSLGSLFSYFGAGRAIDDVLGSKLPYYSKIINPRMDFWCQPEKGRLAGVASTDIQGKEFLMYGCGKNWTIVIEKDIVLPGREMEQCDYFGRSGTPIRTIGERVAGDKFRARRILPLHFGRKIFQQRMNCQKTPTPSLCPHR